MKEKYKISVIVPIFNSSKFIKRCIHTLVNQDFKEAFEIIFVDDASTDNSISLINKEKLNNVKIYTLSKNSGPSIARNIGIKKAKGKYLYFLDSDDTIEINTFSKLYKAANENNYDIVFADKKRIERIKDQRKNIFLYSESRRFFRKDILLELKKRFYDPLYMGGLIGCTGRLFKRSIIINQKLFFNKNLRIREDETFSWNVFSFVKKAKYVREKLYTYHINPNVNTAISQGLNYNLSISDYKTASNQVKKTFEKFNLKKKEIKKLYDQAFIYSIINSLISISRSILLKKINIQKGIKIRKKFIDNILKDQTVIKSVKNYSISPNECSLIPMAILWKNSEFLELACDQRAKKILEIRRKI